MGSPNLRWQMTVLGDAHVLAKSGITQAVASPPEARKEARGDRARVGEAHGRQPHSRSAHPPRAAQMTRSGLAVQRNDVKLLPGERLERVRELEIVDPPATPDPLDELCKLARVDRPEEVGRNGPLIAARATDANAGEAAVRLATHSSRSESWTFTTRPTTDRTASSSRRRRSCVGPSRRWSRSSARGANGRRSERRARQLDPMLVERTS
jgi:hypothetical protein